MPRIIKVRAGDQEFNAIEQQFEIASETWNEYRLLDGGTVRLKTSVQKVFRIVDEEGNPSHTPEGDPHVMVRHNTVVVSSE